MRNIIIKFAASKYEKNGNYGDYGSPAKFRV